MKFCYRAGILLYLTVLLAADEPPVLLELAGRYEDSGEIAGKLTADYRKLKTGLLVIRDEEGGYSFLGGLALPFIALGSLSLRGPLQELIKPGALSASSAKYSDAPAFSLQRGWSPSSRKALVLGLPGTLQFSILEGQGSLPELGFETEVSPRPWIRLAGAGFFTDIPEDTDNAWIRKEGLPPEGELFLGGIRLIVQGEHTGLSCFASTSLHRVLPAGSYLRASCRFDSALLSTRFALSWLDRYYRSSRYSVSPYHLSSAFDVLILPVYPVTGLLRSSARLKHPPVYGQEPADLRFSLEGGAAWVFSCLSGEITRELIVKREEDLYSWEESLGGNVAAYLPGLLGAGRTRLFAAGSYILGYNMMEKASAGFSLRRLPLDVSFSSGISREKELGEPPQESFLIMKGDLALIFNDWEVKAGFSMEGETSSFSLSGGRSFRFPGG